MPSQAAERRYTRVKPPKGFVVACQNVRQRNVSRVEMIGLGGLFISTSDPPLIGDTMQLLFDVAGGEVRARAIVRSILMGQGMGVEIISMQPEHRARLSQWLKQLSVKPEVPKA